MDYDMLIFIFNRISAVFLLCYVAMFSPLRYSVKKTTVILFIGYIILGLIDSVPFFFNDPISSVFKVIFTVLMISAIVNKRRDFRAIYIGASALTYVLTGDIISNIVFRETNIFWLAISIQIVIHTATIVALYKLTRNILITQLSDMNNTNKNWMLLSLSPIIFYAIFVSLGTVKTSTVIIHESNFLSAILLLILMNYISIASLRSLAYQTKLTQNSSENTFLEIYAKRLEKNVQTLENTNEKFAYMRHDIKHYGQMLIGMINNGEYEKIKEAISNINNGLDEYKPAMLCQNIPVNSVLMVYSERAAKSGIQFSCKADIPKTLPNMNEFEYATVVSNLIDNALHATENAKDANNKFISVSIVPVKGMLFLEVMNPYENEIEMSKDDGLPVSKAGEGHGYGMKSIASFAQKHGAEFECTTADHIFRVSIATRM